MEQENSARTMHPTQRPNESILARHCCILFQGPAPFLPMFSMRSNSGRRFKSTIAATIGPRGSPCSFQSSVTPTQSPSSVPERSSCDEMRSRGHSSTSRCYSTTRMYHRPRKGIATLKLFLARDKAFFKISHFQKFWAWGTNTASLLLCSCLSTKEYCSTIS